MNGLTRPLFRGRKLCYNIYMYKRKKESFIHSFIHSRVLKESFSLLDLAGPEIGEIHNI